MSTPNSTQELNIREWVEWITERVPEAGEDPKLLTLIYWQLADEIQIPASVMKEILEKGTNPVSIIRCLYKM